jgi:hypothetical protein
MRALLPWSMKRLVFAVSLLAAALGSGGLLSGCGGGGGGASGGASGDSCYDYDTFEAATPTTSFSKDVLPIFRTACGFSVCHGNKTPLKPALHYFGPSNSSPAPEATDIQAIFDQSVGVAAVEEPTLNVIDPDKPQSSFLLYKLDGVKCATLECSVKDMCGGPMPLSNPQLPEDTRDIIRRWIAQGAKND